MLNSILTVFFFLNCIDYSFWLIIIIVADKKTKKKMAGKWRLKVTFPSFDGFHFLLSVYLLRIKKSSLSVAQSKYSTQHSFLPQT